MASPSANLRIPAALMNGQLFVGEKADVHARCQMAQLQQTD
jgi:hypothetical protein